MNMVATHCVLCGRPLIDAVSCEKGIGPICREKYDYEDAPVIPEENKLEIAVLLGRFDPDFAQRTLDAVNAGNSRKAGNLLVHAASANGRETAINAADVLRVIGYVALADRIEKRLVKIKFSRTPDGRVAVKTPFNGEFVARLKAALPWNARRWDGAAKVWVTEDSPTACAAVDAALKACFSGEVALGPVGAFKIA